MTLRSTITRLLLALVPALALGCSSEYDQTATPPTTSMRVDAHVGKNLTSDSTHIGTVSDHFTPNETVNAVIDVVPATTTGMMDVRWVYGGSGGQTVSEQSVAIVPGTATYHVVLDPPQAGNKPGEYQLEITVNGDRVEVERFTVSPP